MNKTVTDLTAYVTSSLSENNLTYNEFVIQKIIYKIKMKLGENHPLYDKIPYYWHYHGPVSDVVKKSLTKINTTGTDLINKYSEIEAIAGDIIDKGDYIYSDLAEDIYKDYAPSKFSYPFKYKVFTLSENKTLTIKGEKFFNLLKYCNSLLKSEDYDIDYAVTFAKFVRAIDFFNDENLIAVYWQDIQKPLRDLWFTYAEGLRVKIHDSYYDSKEEQWRQIYKESLDKMENEVQIILDKALNAVDSSNYQYYTPHQKEILNATLGVYLRDD